MLTARLRHWITIQRPEPARGAAGGETITWVDWASMHAAVEPLRGQELFAASQVQSKLSVRIRVRYIAGITTKMRVKHVIDESSPEVARYYGIEDVVHIEERRREIQLMCAEREANGWR